MARIAILYELLGRSRGGIEAWIYHASEELLQKGHEVTIYNTQDITPSDAAPQGVKIIKLYHPQSNYAINFLHTVISLKKQLKPEIKSFDAVWARSFTMALAASKNFKKDTVIYINAAPYSSYGQLSIRERLKRRLGLVGFLEFIASEIAIRLAWHLERKAIVSCKNVFLSKSRRDETFLFFKLKPQTVVSFIIPPGVNTNRFKSQGVEWDGSGPLRIISVCRLVPDKNIQCVIQAIAKLVQVDVPVQLTIVGEGNYESKLRELTNDLGLKKYIEFVGRQENVEYWYKNNHVFVLPSLYEGFGSVYIEAMASGLPCIALSGSGSKFSVAADEIISHGHDGLLLKSNDSNELAMCLKKLYEEPKRLNLFSKNARESVLEQFRWEKTIHQLLGLNL